MNELDCDHVTLQDFVDGALDAADERRVREHLASCARCRAEERELRRLLARVAELPPSVAPARDLWPGVAARLGEQPARTRTAAGTRRSWTPGRWALQAAAAIVFMVLGAALGRVVPGAAPPEAAPAPAAASGFAAVEAEYLRAKDALWLVAASRQEEISPVTLEIVRRNLVVIDEAIWGLRRTLEADPGNRELEKLILAQHRRGLDLLRRLTEKSA